MASVAQVGTWTLLALAAPVAAQLSPGPLSRAHVSLEGSRHCLDCHQAGRGVAPSKCLACHGELAERIAGGRGLHARAGYGDCERCHIEHQGRDFELVWWGEGGRESFDHGQTGHPLLGAHARLDCHACHRPERIADLEALTRRGRDPTRTFLGLTGGSCLACHADPHKSQLGSACASCHGQEAWRPTGFDHAESRFPLTGAHPSVACESCHRVEEDGVRRFRGLAFGQCSDCHGDPHAGRFGAACSSCHRTEGWQRVSLAGFDHDRTRFALRGAHAELACESCHPAVGPPRGLAFDRCVACHDDPHQGQFVARDDGGACESCHTIDGFLPSTFDVAQHQATDYPLAGAHLAVSCRSCHAPTRAGGAARFRFAGTGCDVCHGDPHRGEAARFVVEAGCQACHSLAGWREVAFDHARTGWALAGRHATLGCRSRHAVADLGDAGGRLQLLGLSQACDGCHQDPHRGQLAEAAGGTTCERCHRQEGWPLVAFDHDEETAFPLVGAHAALPCAGCHARETTPDGEVFVRRPLPTTCAGCHAGGT